jgi:hypothetical protein
MDNMINSAPMSGGMYDSAYDRSEDAVIKMKTCQECDGNGETYYCDECDENANNCKCLTSQNIKSEKCEHCDGEGEVEI